MKKNRKIVWLVIQVVVLIFCIVYINTMYHKNILPEQKVQETFTQTDCTILSKKLGQVGKLVPRYRADFQVRYSMAGKTYQAMTSANGLDSSFSSDRALEENQLNQFEVGKVYPCWVDASAPQVVVLVLRHDWSQTFSLIFPAVIALIMIYFIGRTLFRASR